MNPGARPLLVFPLARAPIAEFRCGPEARRGGVHCGPICPGYPATTGANSAGSVFPGIRIMG